MDYKPMQCCYTNASIESEGTVASGWQALCVSPNVPEEAFTECTRLQNINSSINQTAVDEDGNTLNLFELSGDGSYLYVMRTLYGLTDRLGRANMFSNAFILPVQDREIIRDPNYYVMIDNDSFRYTAEEAADFNRKFGWIDPPFTIESAMERSGLMADTYRTLIYCVYSQFSDRKTNEPLFIQYDGTEQQMRALLFCVYYALPFSVRRCLSAASCITENTGKKNLIFSKEARSRGLYVDPRSGENNILSSRIEMRLSRLIFLDAVLDKIREVPQSEFPQKYYTHLEKEALLLGYDSSKGNDTILRIAALIMQQQPIDYLDELELEKRMNEALSSDTFGNEEMDYYISSLLSAFTRKGHFLSPQDESLLGERLGQTACVYLKNSCEDYYFARFQSLSDDEAVQQLKSMSGPEFAQYRKLLMYKTSGQMVLERYYEDKVKDDSVRSFQELMAILTETEDLAERRYIEEAAVRKSERFYQQAEFRALQGQYADLFGTWNGYRQMMEYLCGRESGQEQAASKKKDFWRKIRFSDVREDLKEQYWNMRTEDIRSEIINEIFRVCKDCTVFPPDDAPRFMREVSRFATLYKDRTSGPDDTEEMYECLLRILEEETGCTNEVLYWSRLSMKVPPERNPREYVELLCRICGDIQNKDVDGLMAHAKDAFRKDAKLPEDIRRELSRKLIGCCGTFDQEGIPVPLDLWILLSHISYGNSFRVFDQYKPSVLITDSEQVLSDSSFIRNANVQKEAEVYIREKGQEAKKVKRWLSDVQDKRGIFGKSILRKK